MDVPRIVGTALLVSVAIMQPSARAQSVSVNPALRGSVAVDLVVRGRILDETSESLPPSPGWVILSSLWTYRIRIVRVIRGHERSKEIVATNTSDPALRQDVDFVFDLGRTADGTYRVMGVKLARRS